MLLHLLMYDHARRDSRHAADATDAPAPGKRTRTGQLPARVAAAASAALGQDLSSVTVHQDGQADALGTRAFARGDELHFAAGAYQPESPAGLSLIGHELAHVVQQRDGRVAATGAIGGMAVSTDPALEAEADAGGAKVAQGFDLDAFLDHDLPAGRAAATPVVQGADLPVAAASPAAPASPVPAEVMARVGAEFRHTDDPVERHYRISPTGGFVLTAAADGKAIGTEFRHDNKYAAAWQTLATYVARSAATIPPTVAPTPAPAEPTGEPAADESPWSFDGLVGAVGDAVSGAIAAGRALLGQAAQVVQDAIGLATGESPDGATPAPAEPGTAAEPGAPAAVPAVEQLQPTTTALSASVGAGGDNLRDDVILVQYRLRELGYPVRSTGTVDDATVRAIKLFQAARVAHAAPMSTNLVKLVDGRIDQGGATDKALFGGDAHRFAPVEASGVKPLAGKPQGLCDAATGEARAQWDRIIAVWQAVSPYLPGGDTYMSSGLRTTQNQIDIIEDFYTGKYKAQIVAAHGQDEWAKYVGQMDAASVDVKRSRVKACGQDVARPGTSPHEFGRAIDVGGKDDAGQIHALLRVHIEVDASLVAYLLYEKNGCVHFEFAT